MPRPSIVRTCRVALAVLLLAPLPALDPDEAEHLLLRTGFLPTPGEVARLLPLTRIQAIDALLAATRTAARCPPPQFCAIPLLQYQGLRSTGKMMTGAPDRELKAWWYDEMVTTDSPLTERMVLFWHNHFTSGIAKVMDERLLYEQNVLLRRSALGNFALLLRDIDLDAAMFVYLDKDSNRANSPNENYAREVMELFTLGEGQQYTEADIKEAARAFTGYMLDSRGRVVPKGDHDARPKFVLGHAVDSGQDVILQLLLKEERVATYIAGKFYREFVAEQADEVAIRALAAEFYHAKYDIRTLLRATLLSEAFWDARNRGTLVKSPVEFLVGIARALDLPAASRVQLADAGKRLGQDLFEPPNVKGWRGGNTWLNTETLLQRWRLVDVLVGDTLHRGDPVVKPKARPAPQKAGAACALVPLPWLDEAAGEGAAGIARAVAVLLPLPPAEPIPATGFVQALRGVLHDATFHLK